MARKQSESVEIKLKRIIATWHYLCIGHEGGTLSQARSNLKARYLGYGFKNDAKIKQQGWSTAVSRDVFEVVEWAKPGLMRIFSSGDEIVRFEPNHPGEEQACQDATDYVNALLARNSFSIVHHCLTDALYQRVGWCKAWYDKHEEPVLDEYEGLTEEEATAILMAAPQKHRVEVKARGLDGEDDGGQLVYDVKIRGKEEVREIRIDPIPSENVVIAQDARDVNTARFVAHWEDRMASDLIKEGYNREVVGNLPRVATGRATDWPERQLTREVNAENTSNATYSGDETTDLIRVWEAYAYCDINNDGIAERVRMVYAGDPGTADVLEWEEWPNSRPPIFGVCSVPLPHTPVGLSLADGVIDIEQEKSELLRYMFDALFLSNQGELHVNKKAGGEIDYDQLLSRSAGGVIESTGDVTITPLPVGTETGPTALAALQFLDKVKESRTGIGQNLMGVQADELQGTATGASIKEDAINQRLEMIARVFAEQFFKPLAKYIVELLRKYQDKPMQIALKGRLMDLDPRRWSSEWDVKATVGLGTGNRTRQAQGLIQIMQIQQQIAQAVGPQLSPVKLHHVIYAAHQLAQGLGFQSPEQFFGTTEEAMHAEAAMANQPPKADPNQQKIQIMQQQAQAKMQLEAAKVNQQAQLQGQKLAADFALKREEAAADMQLKQQELGAEQQLKAMEMNMRHVQHVPTPQIQEQKLGGVDGL